MKRLVWPWRSKGNWDHGMLIRYGLGDLWPGTGGCRDELDFSIADGHGVVVGFSAGYARSEPARLEEFRQFLRTVPWALILHLSDEALDFDAEILREDKVKLWVQCARPGRTGDRALLLGWPYDTRELMLWEPTQNAMKVPLAERPQRWTFAGQVNHDQRRVLAYEISQRTDGDLFVSRGFSQGRPPKAHLLSLAQGAVACCPSGYHTPDTFRLYEALEAGCLPICDRKAPRWGSDLSYWNISLGFEPFPCVDSWSEVHGLLDKYEDPVALQHDANRATAWWQGYKRSFAVGLDDESSLLRGARPRSRHDVTVVMPTSSIPSHPDTSIIEEAIRRTRAYPELRDAEVIVMVDGLHPDHQHRAGAYEEYKRRLIHLCAWHPDFRGVLPLVFSEHTHQANMTRRALQMVRSPLVFFQEHDTYPVHEIDWSGLIKVVAQRGDVNQVQLHIDERISDEHRYLMIDGGAPRQVGPVTMARHRKWSQRPHLAKTQWYRDRIAEFFGVHAKTMIEDVLHGCLENRVGRGIDPWEKWGTWIYAPEGAAHGILRSATTDGRGGEPKLPMLVEYDGATPDGAPAPGTWK